MNSSRATSVTDKARLWFSYLFTRHPSTLPTIPPHTSYWRFCCEASSYILLLADADNADNADPPAAAGGVQKESTNDRLARDKRRVLSSDNPLKWLKTLNPNPKCGRIALNGESRQDWISCPFFCFSTFAKIIILKIRGIRDFFSKFLDVASLPKGI